MAQTTYSRRVSNSMISLFGWVMALVALTRTATTTAFQPDESQETLRSFRARNNHTFQYQPVAIQPEACRFHNETECEAMDHHARRLQRRIRPVIGDQKAIVILLELTGFTTAPKADFDQLFNGRNRDEELNPTGSLWEYFKKNSLGKVDFEYYILDWTPSANSEKECAGPGGSTGFWEGWHDCWYPALDRLEAKHNDAQDSFRWGPYDSNEDGFIDNLIIVHNGYAAENGANDPAGTPPSERIRSFAAGDNGSVWTSDSMGIRSGFYATVSAFRGLEGDRFMRMNIAAHEIIHTYGPIDLYDLDFCGWGVGFFDIMAFPTGQNSAPATAGNVGAYTKQDMGWVFPYEVTEDGTYPIKASFLSPDVYKISEPYPEGEYLLIENRQALEWDIDFFGGGGIVIWHIDETKSANTCNEARVSVVQADGNNDLEKKENRGDVGDIWRSDGPNDEVSDSGSPNIKSRRTGQNSGIRIHSFSENGIEMRFTVEGLSPSSPTVPPVETEEPVAPPTAAPTEEPVVPPTVSPTAAPVASTEAPVAPTIAPTTDPTSDPTATPEVDSTEAPTVTAAETTAPSTVTEAPVAETESPITEVPTAVTEAPTSPTEAPVILTTESAVPSQVPVALIDSPTETDASSVPTEPPVVILEPPLSTPPSPAPSTDVVDATTNPAEPQPQCPVQINQSGCAALMPTITPDDACDCYSFCDGRPDGCCNFGEACPITCGGDYVGGCVFFPTDAPTTSPTPRPTLDQASPPPVEPATCFVETDTTQCDQFMLDVTPSEDCDCYNFCNGNELNCCNFGEACVLQCQGNLIAGCTVQEPETPIAGPQGQCFVTISTDLCEALVAAQEPVEDCDCYNYCSDGTVTCCPYGEFCPLNCVGRIVAGCQLDQAPVPPTPAPFAASPTFFFWPDGFTAPKRNEGDL